MLEVLTIIVVSILLMLISSDILVRTIVDFSKKVDFPPYLITFFSISMGSALPEIINSIVLSINNLVEVGFFNILNNLVIDFTLVMGIGLLLLKSEDIISINKHYVYSMLIVYIIFLFLILDGKILTGEGIVLFLSYLLVFSYLIYINKKALTARRSIGISIKETLKYSLLAGASIFVLIVNANIIYALVKILISHFKLAPYIIGFLLGFFTVMPEFLVTIVSYISLKRSDIAIFNLFGTFISDLTLGIGIPSAIVGFVLTNKLFLIYLGVFILYVVMLLSDLIVIRGKIPKEFGFLLIGAYVLYILVYTHI